MRLCCFPLSNFKSFICASFSLNCAWISIRYFCIESLLHGSNFKILPSLHEWVPIIGRLIDKPHSKQSCNTVLHVSSKCVSSSLRLGKDDTDPQPWLQLYLCGHCLKWPWISLTGKFWPQVGTEHMNSSFSSNSAAYTGIALALNCFSPGRLEHFSSSVPCA